MGFMPVVTRSFFVFSGENRGDIEVKRATGRQDNERNTLLIMAQWHTGMGRGTIGRGDTSTAQTRPTIQKFKKQAIGINREFIISRYPAVNECWRSLIWYSVT